MTDWAALTRSPGRRRSRSINAENPTGAPGQAATTASALGPSRKGRPAISLDSGETALLGCVYVDPPDDSSPSGTDAVSSWWVVDGSAGTDLERALDSFVPRWLAETWGFRSVHHFP